MWLNTHTETQARGLNTSANHEPMVSLYTVSLEKLMNGQLTISQGPLPDLANIYEIRNKIKKNERPGKLFPIHLEGNNTKISSKDKIK